MSHSSYNWHWFHGSHNSRVANVRMQNRAAKMLSELSIYCKCTGTAACGNYWFIKVQILTSAYIMLLLMVVVVDGRLSIRPFSNFYLDFFIFNRSSTLFARLSSTCLNTPNWRWTILSLTPCIELAMLFTVCSWSSADMSFHSNLGCSKSSCWDHLRWGDRPTIPPACLCKQTNKS